MSDVEGRGGEEGGGRGEGRNREMRGGAVAFAVCFSSLEEEEEEGGGDGRGEST